MLSVRRVSITDVLKLLQDEGLIRGTRGRIAVLDRKGTEGTGKMSCECYRAVKDEYDRLIG